MLQEVLLDFLYRSVLCLATRVLLVQVPGTPYSNGKFCEGVNQKDYFGLKMKNSKAIQIHIMGGVPQVPIFFQKLLFLCLEIAPGSPGARVSIS
jgi:hypothetical protein